MDIWYWIFSIIPILPPLFIVLFYMYIFIIEILPHWDELMK